jgi:hypothetical protein
MSNPMLKPLLAGAPIVRVLEHYKRMVKAAVSCAGGQSSLRAFAGITRSPEMLRLARPEKPELAPTSAVTDLLHVCSKC